MSNGLGWGVGEKAHLYKDSYKMQKKKIYQMRKTSVWDKGMAGSAIKG